MKYNAATGVAAYEAIIMLIADRRNTDGPISCVGITIKLRQCNAHFGESCSLSLVRRDEMR